MNWIVTEERMKELCRAEIQLKIAQAKPEDPHYEANTQYWQKQLDEGTCIYPYQEGQTAQHEPGLLMELIGEDLNKRLYEMESSLEAREDWDVLFKVLEMDVQDCYSLFGMGNSSLDNVENLHSMLVNCLLDDSYLGVKLDSHKFMRATWVGDDHENCIYEKELLELIELAEAGRKFYEANQDLIENKTRFEKDNLGWKASMEYHRLNTVFQDKMEEYGCPEVKAHRQAERDKHDQWVADLHERVEERRNARTDDTTGDSTAE
jgi:hypothetical protein